MILNTVTSFENTSDVQYHVFKINYLDYTHGFYHMVLLKEYSLMNPLDQGSPTFLKLRATLWVLTHTKGYQFDRLFWNNKFAQFAFSYILLLVIDDSHLCEDTDHVNDLQ